MLPINESIKMTPDQAIAISGHASAWTAFIGWFIGMLPSVATAVTIVWFTILIVEKVTGSPFHELARNAWRKVFRR